jgi:preprotein translocase subunit SecG
MVEFLLFANSSGFFLGLLGVILFLISLFLVFIILIQRGKGGGIAGSLTGTAQSAFGARGGDILMWLTLSLTIIWILLCCVTIFFYSRVQDAIAEGKDDADIPSTVPSDLSPPELTTPDATTPDATTPDATTPDATTPDATTPDTTTPVPNDASSDDTEENKGAENAGTPAVDEPESTKASGDDQKAKEATSGNQL